MNELEREMLVWGLVGAAFGAVVSLINAARRSAAATEDLADEIRETRFAMIAGKHDPLGLVASGIAERDK